MSKISEMETALAELEKEKNSKIHELPVILVPDKIGYVRRNNSEAIFCN
jgi:hypothetical protein